MNRSRIHLVLMIAAAALAAPSAVRAQVDTGAPISVKAPKVKLARFKGEVLSASTLQIIVRSQENSALVRTFTYTPEVREKMQKVIDAGGYQHGDRVEIEHEPGKDVAIKIKGKPSKPI